MKLSQTFYFPHTEQSVKPRRTAPKVMPSTTHDNAGTIAQLFHQPQDKTQGGRKNLMIFIPMAPFRCKTRFKSTVIGCVSRLSGMQEPHHPPFRWKLMTIFAMISPPVSNGPTPPYPQHTRASPSPLARESMPFLWLVISPKYHPSCIMGPKQKSTAHHPGS